MPLKPGERYLSVEVDIMRKLSWSRFRLGKWEANRKNDTTTSAIEAAGPMVIYKFSERPPFNMLGDVEGEIVLKDVGCLDRSLEFEKVYPCLSLDALRYGLCYFAERQDPVRRPRTFLFNVNPCAIDLLKVGGRNQALLHQEFDKLVARANPVDPFERKYIIIPVYYQHQGFVTIIRNAYALVKPSWDKSEGGCDMWHIGPATSDDDSLDGLEFYKRVIVPKIKFIMRKFFDKFAISQEYTEYREDLIKEHEVLLPDLPSEERAFQLLWVLKRIMRGPGDLDNTRDLIANMQQTPKEDALKEMERIRQHLWLSLSLDIERVGEKAVAHILRHRTRCIYYEKAHPFDQESEEFQKQVNLRFEIMQLENHLGFLLQKKAHQGEVSHYHNAWKAENQWLFENDDSDSDSE